MRKLLGMYCVVLLVMVACVAEGAEIVFTARPDPNDNYDNLGTLLGSAASGDIIKFSGLVTLPIQTIFPAGKQLTFQGDNATLEMVLDRTTMFYVGSSGDVTFRNLTLKGAGSRHQAENGGFVTQTTGSKVHVFGCDMIDFQARLDGGVFHMTGGELVIESSTVSLGFAQNGGVVYGSSKADVRISDSIFSSNTASQNGGVLSLHGESVAVVSNSLFQDNKALVGAVVEGIDSSVTLTSNLFKNNDCDRTNQGSVMRSLNSTVGSISTNEFFNNRCLDTITQPVFACDALSTCTDSGSVFNPAADCTDAEFLSGAFCLLCTTVSRSGSPSPSECGPCLAASYSLGDGDVNGVSVCQSCGLTCEVGEYRDGTCGGRASSLACRACPAANLCSACDNADTCDGCVGNAIEFGDICKCITGFYNNAGQCAACPLVEAGVGPVTCTNARDSKVDACSDGYDINEDDYKEGVSAVKCEESNSAYIIGFGVVVALCFCAVLIAASLHYYLHHKTKANSRRQRKRRTGLESSEESVTGEEDDEGGEDVEMENMQKQKKKRRSRSDRN